MGGWPRDFPILTLRAQSTLWLYRVGLSWFEYVDGQKAEWALRVAIAKDCVWDVGSILQGFACSIPTRLIAAVS